jgi:hypothetical protein
MVNVCFGSQAACRYFITWAAAYGQERPLVEPAIRNFGYVNQNW